MYIEKLRQSVKNCKVVTFDIFDTLLVRDFKNPTDLFLYMQYLLIQEKPILYQNFAFEREAAEHKAMAFHRKHTGHGNIFFKEIYALINEMYTKSTDKVDPLLEKEIEKLCLKPRTEIVELFYEAKKLGKRVGIISDMYLDSNFMEMILESHGIKNYDFLYMSCEHECSKSESKLFSHIFTQEKKYDPTLKRNEIYHIGDNPHADGKMALEQSFLSQVIPKRQEVYKTIWDKGNFKGHWENFQKLNYKIWKNLSEGFYYNYAANYEKEKSHPVDFFHSVGFEVLGPLVASFCQYIKQYVEENDIKTILFTARDCLIMKECFEIFYPEFIKEKGIKTHYVFASRKIVNPATIEELDETNVYMFCYLGNSMTISKALERYGIDVEKNKETILQYYPSLDTKVSNGEKKYSDLLLILKKEFINGQKEGKKNYIAYLKSLNIEGSTLILDLGWEGSLMTSMKKLLDKINNNNTNYILLYLLAATEENSFFNPISLSPIVSYLCHKGVGSGIEKNFSRSSKGIIELLFEAPEASIQKLIQTQEGKFEVLRAQEFESNIMSAKKRYEGAKEYFKLLKPYINKGMPDGIEYIKSLLYRVTEQPTKEEVKSYSNISFSGDVGHLNELFIIDNRRKINDENKRIWHKGQFLIWPWYKKFYVKYKNTPRKYRKKIKKMITKRIPKPLKNIVFKVAEYFPFMKKYLG